MKYQPKLQQAKNYFLSLYPEGFEDPKIASIVKKHRVPTLVELAQKNLSSQSLSSPNSAQHIVDLVNKSSLVSRFEKVKIQHFFRSLDPHRKEQLLEAVKTLIHHNQPLGFDQLHRVLSHDKLAKWPIMTVFGAYYDPENDLLVKPTTAKKIIHFFGLKDVKYAPNPFWDFYQNYRHFINELKEQSDHRFGSYNIAFCGFLMVSIDGLFSE